MMNVTYVWRLPSVLPALQPLRLGVVTGVVAVLLFLLDRDPRRRLVDLPSVPMRFVAVLVAAMILATPAGLYPTNSALYLARTVLPALLLMIMLAASVRSVEDIEWFAAANLVAAAGYGLFVLWVFRVGRDGRLSELIYYDANDLGLLLVATLPFVAYFASRAHRRRRRLIAFCCAPLFLLLLVRTGSRGGFVGLIIALGYFGWTYRGLSRQTRLAAIAFIALMFVIAGGASYGSKIATLFNPTQDYNWDGRSPTGRVEIWKRGLGYVLDRPLGVGVNNFMRAEGNLSAIGRDLSARGEPFKWSVAHNSYLETAVESGVLGVVAFLALLGTTFVLLRRLIGAMGRLPFLTRELALAQVLTAALLGYWVCAFFVSAEYFTYLYTLLGLAIGLAKVTPVPAGRTGT